MGCLSSKRARLWTRCLDSYSGLWGSIPHGRTPLSAFRGYSLRLHPATRLQCTRDAAILQFDAWMTREAAEEEARRLALRKPEEEARLEG